MQEYFNHEKLVVYQEAIAFISWWVEVSQHCPAPASIRDQIDRASTSVPLNIAEGNAKYSPRDRSRYFQIACGSALECGAGLDVLVARGSLTGDEIGHEKLRLRRIVSMLVRLIDNSTNRISEENDRYDPAGNLDDDLEFFRSA
jgi:four helix bundle protein